MNNKMVDDRLKLIPTTDRKTDSQNGIHVATAAEKKNPLTSTSKQYGAFGEWSGPGPPEEDHTPPITQPSPLSPEVTVVKPHNKGHLRDSNPDHQSEPSSNGVCLVAQSNKSNLSKAEKLPCSNPETTSEDLEHSRNSSDLGVKSAVSLEQQNPEERSPVSCGLFHHFPFLRTKRKRKGIPKHREVTKSDSPTKSSSAWRFQPKVWFQSFKSRLVSTTGSKNSPENQNIEEKGSPNTERAPLFKESIMGDKYKPSKDSDMEMREKEEEGTSKFFIYYLACFATIGGLLFGYDTGIVSGSMLLIEDYFDLSTIWKELIVSGTVGAAAVFAFIGGFACDIFGRKLTIMTASLVFVGGAILMGASNSKEMLLGGRIVVGIGIGFASMAVPVYVAEAAPVSIRGRLVTLNQLFITIGILVSSLIAGAFSEMKETGWRYMLGLAGIPGVIQFVGFLFLPESPRWLVAKGRQEEARKVLVKIRATPHVDREMEEIKAALETEKQQSGFVLGRVLRTPHVRKALFVGCGLQVFQQMCGINTVIYYSASILRMAGFPAEAAIWLVAVPNSINFLATIVGVALVERLGRRKLLLGSFVGVMFALMVLAVGFQLSSEHTPNIDTNITETFANGTLLQDGCFDLKVSTCESCIEHKDCGFCYSGSGDQGTCLFADPDDEDVGALNGRCNKTSLDVRDLTWAHGYCPTDYTWMAVLGLTLFVMGFAPGLGPMPWTINSEIYPLWARGTCTSIATACNWVFNLIVSLFFLTLTETITNYGAFWLFCGLCFLGLIFSAVFVPETKNKSLEEVQRLFMGETGWDNVAYEAEIPRPATTTKNDP